MSDKREDYYDIIEINKMQNFVDEYEYTIDELTTTINHLKTKITDKSLEETIEGMFDYIKDNENIRYNDYKEILTEFEYFNINDYDDNEGIWEDYQRDIMGGLK